jgi:hypothetical protein
MFSIQFLNDILNELVCYKGIIMPYILYNLMHCSGHQLDYEKKSVKITWLRCEICGNVLGWLEDDRQMIEGKVTRLSYSEKRTLR